MEAYRTVDGELVIDHAVDRYVVYERTGVPAPMGQHGRPDRRARRTLGPAPASRRHRPRPAGRVGRAYAGRS